MHFIDPAYAATAATADTGSGPLATLGINPVQFGEQLLNFIVVALIIWFLILKPLTQKLTERQKMIDDAIENSRRVQETLEKSEQKYQEKIDQAKVEAHRIMEQATLEAEKTGAALKAKTKQEIEILVAQVKRTITTEREDMRAELKKETAALVTLALEKILAEKVTDKKDKEFIGSAVKELRVTQEAAKH